MKNGLLGLGQHCAGNYKGYGAIGCAELLWHFKGSVKYNNRVLRQMPEVLQEC
jgi:hypothetical protein